MVAAYEQAWHRLHLQSRQDPIPEMVAKQIIEIAKTGEKDPARVCTLAIEKLGLDQAPD